jgi:S1-C subfamily serine protease
MDSLPEGRGSLQSFSDSLAGVVESAGNSVVEINTGRRLRSSGVHWRQGIVVTVSHALKHDEDIRITGAGGFELRARIAGRDPGSDLAAVSIDSANIPVAKAAEQASLRVGQVVLAIGRSDGLAAASFGIISWIGGAWRTWRGAPIDHLIRPDVGLIPGFSGGPLVDAEGFVLGINTAGLSRTAPLTVPVSSVNRVVDELVKAGKVSRGFLGVGLYGVKIPRRVVEAHGLTTAAGLVIVNVELDGPADKAGLVVGDILVALNGHPVSETDDVQGALDPESIGKAVTASIIRGGSPLNVEITVAERRRRAC